MSGNKARTGAVAMDCEMVGTGPNGFCSMVARVSIVNEYYDCLYDVYVTPTKRVTDYRTPVSGIMPHHLESGRPLSEVKKVVTDILRGAILVGHDVGKDLKVLEITHPNHKIRDTAYYLPIRQNPNKTPSLKYLAAKYAGMNIQNGSHNSVTDAVATMKVYKKFEGEWEKRLKKSGGGGGSSSFGGDSARYDDFDLNLDDMDNPWNNMDFFYLDNVDMDFDCYDFFNL